MSSSKYSDLGASASKAGLHQTLSALGLEHQSGFFASLIDDMAGDPNYYSFLHCDGAGTKTIVAYLFYREHRRAQAFRGLAQDALVMNLDDIFCIGIPQRMIISNLVARNAKLIGDDALREIISGYYSLCEILSRHGIQIELGGGETADCGDTVRTLVTDAVLAGRIERARTINTRNIAVGDLIVGLSSTGRAEYEDNENSGIGSNGLTLARHALLSHSYLKSYPEILAPEVERRASYTGPFSIDDTPEDLEMSVGTALLSPTRSYAPVLLRVYEELKHEVHGVIHCTGGGQTKVLRFGEHKRYVKRNLFPTPPIFQLIEEHGKVSRREMYQVFNMGHRMELYVPELRAEEVIAISRAFGVDARVVGHVEESKNKNEVVIEDQGESYHYSL